MYINADPSVFSFMSFTSFVQVTTALIQAKPPTLSTPVPRDTTVFREPRSAPSSPAPVDPTILNRTPPVTPLVSPVRLPSTAPKGPQTQA